MHCCPTCSFVFNAAFDPSLLSYGSDYDNTQSASPSFDRYTDSLAQRILSAAPSSPSSTPLRIVEVGCGKGAFLRKLLSLHPTATGIGFDPTYVGPLSDLAGRLRFEQRFYDHHAAAHPADIVVCRHVIEHVPQPLLLLESVHAALAQSPSPLVCFETPDVTWILRHGVIWDFFYEHCSLFRPASITRAFQSAGFHVTGVHAVFGDQYMWTEAGRAAAPSPSNPPAHHSGGDIPAMCQQFARQEQQRLASWRHMIERYSQRGPVMIWGAAGPRRGDLPCRGGHQPRQAGPLPPRHRPSDHRAR
jgi:2-polyprenyl-3-methyl-5-hydroxy-6-metoxy-1,4-benzoquinol methylase